MIIVSYFHLSRSRESLSVNKSKVTEAIVKSFFTQYTTQCVSLERLTTLSIDVPRIKHFY